MVKILRLVVETSANKLVSLLCNANGKLVITQVLIRFRVKLATEFQKNAITGRYRTTNIPQMLSNITQCKEKPSKTLEHMRRFVF